MKRIAQAFLALMFVTVAATRAADDQPKETEYYPLKVGTTWTYKVNGTTLIAKVVKYEEFEKQMCARVETSKDDKVLTSEHIAIKDDGVYRHAYADKKADPPVLFLKLPPEKDKTWTVDSTCGGERVTGTFKSGMLDEVVVPAGTYKDVYTTTADCETNGMKISLTYFFAKGVGIIKQTIKIGGGPEVVVELDKFEEGKKAE